MTFSIITVVYNGAEWLRGTMGSIMKQSDQEHIEYILVDGASKDHSLEIIKEMGAKMPYVRWVSEPDKGLYDAMNKALRMATGDFVWFINCGDYIHDARAVEKLLPFAKDPDVGVIYGETMLINAEGDPVGTMSELSTRTLPECLTVGSFLGGMKVVHQSFIARRSLCGEYLTDNLCADYDWCIRILKKSKKNVRAEFILSEYLMGGISKQRHRQSLKDRFAVMRRHFGLFKTLMAHAWIVLRAVKHQIFRAGKAKY